MKKRKTPQECSNWQGNTHLWLEEPEEKGKFHMPALESIIGFHILKWYSIVFLIFFLYFFSLLLSPHSRKNLTEVGTLIYVTRGAVMPLSSILLWSFSTFWKRVLCHFYWMVYPDKYLMFFIKRYCIKSYHFKVPWSINDKQLFRGGVYCVHMCACLGKGIKCYYSCPKWLHLSHPSAFHMGTCPFPWDSTTVYFVGILEQPQYQA